MGIVLTDIDLVNMNTAISTNFLLWALILFCCPHPGWTTQPEGMVSLEVKMTNIMGRMSRMEAEMVAKDEIVKARDQRITVLEAAIETLEDAMETRDKRIGVLEDAMETRDKRIAVLEADKETKDQRIAVLEDAVETLEKAVITKDDFTKGMETRDTQMLELEEEMASLTGRMDLTEETDVLLRGMVDQVRNPPSAFQCAWQDGWTADNSVITYDRLTYDEISGGSICNGGLDINTGVFTVGQGYAGTWEISYSIRSTQYSGEGPRAWLYINGEQIAESYHSTGYSGSEGQVSSLGSRSLYMRLESGDTISLRTGEVGHGLYQITLCFNLAQFDYVPPM